jgi:RNA polymerase sigma factor (sigma-70 family)
MTQLQFNAALIDLKEKLHYYALSLTSDSEKANDLLQETNLKVLTYRDKFAQDTNFKAWVYTIMRNTFINGYRRNVKTKNTFQSSNKEYVMNISQDKVYPSPESMYGLKEIHKKIDALDNDFRIPFTMFVEGYKYKEIAKEMDLPLGTVKSRIFFTRKKLASALAEYATV